MMRLIWMLVALLVAGTQVRGATITVQSNADGGGGCPGASCTLRQAVAVAAPGDTINFSGVTLITLTSTLTIQQGVFISGPGRDVLTIKGNSTPVIALSPSLTATIHPFN